MPDHLRIIPVCLAPPRAGSPDDFAGRCPVINVHAVSDPDWSAVEAREPPRHNGRLYQAMLDTGAESTAIDAALARDIGAKVVAKGIAHGWVGGNAPIDIVNFHVIIPKINVVFSPSAAIRDFRGNGQQWDILLGRSFLQHCRLVVDGPGKAYSLEWTQ